MLTKNEEINQFELFRNELENLLDMEDPLCKMAKQINWKRFEEEFSRYYCEDNGRPSKTIRQMESLEYLKQKEGQSDEEIVEKCVENPYWQYFSGERYFQKEKPVEASLLVKFREKIGKEGMELLLRETIELGLKTKTIRRKSFKKVIVDTTVQEKNITYPTDAKSQNKVREKLVKLAREVGIKLRESYKVVSVRELVAGARYAYARQMRRAKKSFKKVKIYLGRVIRDVERKWDEVSDEVKKKFEQEYEKTKRIAKILENQTQKSKDKIYSVSEPQVECIGKGKVNKKYEFGVKVGVGVTHKEGFVLSSEAYFGNPYDGHTLKRSLETIERNTKTQIKKCFVDRGYKGHKVEEVEVFISGQKRGVSDEIKKEIKRRSLVEGMISHMKRKCHLGKNYLHGIKGDENNAILSGVGHNMRLIWNNLAVSQI